MEGKSGAPRKLALVADDYGDAAELLGEFLEMSTNCEAISVTDGLQAVSMTLERKPAVVILDVQMPRISGIEAAKRIRAEMNPPPLIIALTGRPPEKVQHDGAFDHVLHKPLDVARLLPLIEAALTA